MQNCLIHEGIDTVELEGEGFKLYVKAGQRVHANDPLIEFDAEFLADKGYDTTCIIVLTNPEQFPDVSFVTDVDGVQNKPGSCVFKKYLFLGHKKGAVHR